MLATVLVLWCLAAVVVAPVVGRAIRQGRTGPAITEVGVAEAAAPAKPSRVVAEVA